MKEWRKYERLVAKLLVEQSAHDATVIPNARLMGKVSGVQRQIDALVDCRFDHCTERRIIVDAKRYKRRIDVKHVEEFEGLMKDVQASRGVLVCPNGYTAAALKRAQDSISIRLVPLADVETLDLMSWDRCARQSCSGLVLWDAHPALEIGGLWTIFATAKCDECRRFNVWCWDCGEKFVLDDVDEHRCSCKGIWFWLTSLEDDSVEAGQRVRANYLVLVFAPAYYAIIDRRPIE